jgi:predicted Zn finger-like uncharacterized protein
LLVTCPNCRTRYRVDVEALARPGGRTVRCAACGLSWLHPPAAVEGDLLARTAIAELRLLEPTIAAPSRAEAVAPPPRRRFWFRLGLPIFVVLIVLAVLAALYMFR